MAEIVKLQAKQVINSALHHYNRPNITLVYDLLLNSKVFIWRESGNQTRPYYLLAIKGKMYSVQLSSGLTSFRTTSIKPYFRSKTFKTTYNNELNELKGLETPLPTSELTLKPIKPIELTISTLAKHGQRRLKKNPVTKSHLISVNALVKELPPIDILVLI